VAQGGGGAGGGGGGGALFGSFMQKLTNELQIMEALWRSRRFRPCREIQEAVPGKKPASYFNHGADHGVPIGKPRKRSAGQEDRQRAHLSSAEISRRAAQRRLIDELLSFFGGRTQTVMGATDRIRQDDTRRRAGGGANPPPAREKGQVVMIELFPTSHRRNHPVASTTWPRWQDC